MLCCCPPVLSSAALRAWIWDLLPKNVYTLPGPSFFDTIRVLAHLCSLWPWIPQLFQNLLLVTQAGPEPQNPSTGQPEPRRQCRNPLMSSGEPVFQFSKWQPDWVYRSASLCSRLGSAGTLSIEESPHLLHQRILLVLPAPNPWTTGPL